MSGGASEFELEVLRLINIERANEGIAPLAANPSLMMAARFKSQSMADIGYFSHESPVFGSFSNLPRELFNIDIWAENIAAGQRTAQAVVTSWMNSPGHRANIMNPARREIGIGMHNFHWTQQFR
ncbi:MAG: CAP domain-containing protein, partial [Defluviitaleaceae bacterium]|nr:CAP domain-containing protein [Defluviitaleaceae bacterium]